MSLSPKGRRKNTERTRECPGTSCSEEVSIRKKEFKTVCLPALLSFISTLYRSTPTRLLCTQCTAVRSDARGVSESCGCAA
eukprot:3294998-Prymnesium_polylepis.1